MTSADEALGLARLYTEGRNYQKAADVLGQALQHNPDSPALLIEMARTQLGMENPVAAASSAYGALTRAPDDVYAMRVYAITLDRLGRHHEATSLAYRAVTADSQNYLAHYTYASMLLNAGHAAAALTVVTEALRWESADADVHFLRGRILDKLRRLEESTAAYEEALRLEPDYAAAVHNIALNKLNRGHFGRALHGFLGAARMDPEIGNQVRRNIGIALLRPLRWTTLMALLVSFFGIVAHEPPFLSVPRGLTAFTTLVLVALLVWVLRLLPRSARRSVARDRPMLVVRGGLAVFAVIVGVLSVLGVVPAVSLPLSTVLMLAALVTIMFGWLSGT